MSTVKSKQYQIGSDATPSNNFTIYQPSSPDGSLRIGVGNADNPTEVAQFTSSGMTMASGKTLPASALTGDLPALNGSALTNLSSANLTGALPALDGSALTGVSGGKILQAVTTTKTDVFSSSSTSFVDVTGLSLSITPSASDSKILVMFSVAFHGSHQSSGHIRFMRDSTMLVPHTGAYSSRIVSHGSGFNVNQESNLTPVSFTFLDSPATTSAVTYKAQIHSGTGNTQYVNRTSFDGDNANYGRYSSTIVAMEVSA